MQYETLQEKTARESAERRQQEAQETSRRQGSQIEKLNREAGLRNGERQELTQLLESEAEQVRICREQGTPDNEAKLAEIQTELLTQVKKVSSFDRGYVERLGLLATE